MELCRQRDKRGAAESASTGTMEGFQKSAEEQHNRVNGYCEPKSPQDTADVRWTTPERESAGSDSCGGRSVSELTDVQDLKARESENEEDKEDKEVVPASKGLKGDQKKREKESQDPEENDHSRQNSSAASSYTGETFTSNSHLMLSGKLRPFR